MLLHKIAIMWRSVIGRINLFGKTMKSKLLIGTAALWLSACVVSPYHQQTTAAGAVLGGTTGALITHDARGAVSGALIGGALGSLVGYNSGYYRGDGYYGGRQSYRPAYGHPGYGYGYRNDYRGYRR